MLGTEFTNWANSFDLSLVHYLKGLIPFLVRMKKSSYGMTDENHQDLIPTVGVLTLFVVLFYSRSMRPGRPLEQLRRP